jgi:hypothetical protein
MGELMRTVTTATQSETDLVTQALTEFIRHHNELANAMNDLHVTGGNGLITAQGAKHLADQHLMLSIQADNMVERIGDRVLAFLNEVDI